MENIELDNEKKILDLKNEIRKIKNKKPLQPKIKLSEVPFTTGLHEGIKHNGIKYTVRSNRNRIFTPVEWKHFYDCLKPSQQFTADFLINTGARINEAYNVKIIDCYDVDNKRITFTTTKVRARAGEKTPIPRPIKISTQFAKRLKKHINNLSDDIKKNKNNKIGILSQVAFSIAMKKALIKADIKDFYMFSPHQIRKTAENWIWSLGVPTEVFVKTFGHNIDTATGHYLKNDTYRFAEKDMMHEIIGDWAERLKGVTD